MAQATVYLGLVFGASVAFAAPPPANTVIGNQASATYSDAGGNQQLATSNLVQTTVQQVGSFNLDSYTTVTTNVVNNKTGAAGATVYAPHVLTNTGNGSDVFDIKVDAAAGGFSRVEIFADANGDGLPDSTSALCTAIPAATCSVPGQTVAGNNGVFQFVVAYTIPSTASTPTTPYSFGTVTATVAATSPVITSYASTSAADRDNVNLTTSAAFNVTKAIGVPAVKAPGGGAWPTAAASGPRSSSATCSTIWAAGMTSSATCQYTVYTINVSNTGGAVGALALQDTLPSGFSYVAGSAVWSNSPTAGTALTDASTADLGGIDYQASGNTITAVIKALPVNVSQTISFVVLVNDTAAIGVTTTTNTVKYNPIDAGTSADSTAPGTLPSTSNPAAFTVLASYGFAIGTNLPTVSTAVTAKDVTPGTADGSADTTTQPSVIPGGSVSFPNRVFNTGNATDAINLATSGSTFPAGTTFTLLAVDGATPLLDTTGDGIPDTGPIAAGGYVDIVVRANVPATATLGSGPFTVLVTGKSAGNPAVAVDATKEIVTAVIGSLVDLTNSIGGTGTGTVAGGDLGPGPSPSPTTTRIVAAGTAAFFNLFVKNGDSLANTYNLSASQTPSFPGTLPAGWTVKFVTVGTAGTAGETCATAPAITQIDVAVGAQGKVDVCVTPPATQTPVAGQKIYFRVDSTKPTSTTTPANDTKTDAVTVIAASTLGATLTPDNSGQVAPGGSVVYAHTLTATGTQSCAGPYAVSVSLPSADETAGWTTAVYIDANGDGQIDAGDPLITGTIPGPLVGGTSQKLLVKVFAPGGATAGATDTATVTVTFPSGVGSCGTPTATDVSTVISGQVRVVKTQAADANCDASEAATPAAITANFSTALLTMKPGQCVLYRIVATNEGVAPISNLKINDAVPAYTSLTGATQPAAATQCSSTGLTGTAVAYAGTAPATTVSCGSAANTLAPGGTATLIFAVKINQ
ncbi:beta strand repeat-containing protein [Variovorax sp. 38R]|uniref:beta strand repeat-containing protein n=1 Tax=Variovorax sp. 38R TaxID=2774875 RepID=UPI00177E7796|nr:hypothetical protein [Variovorax sp. 38R]QOF77551.1 hypothetical protein IG196_24890 [Variovorax sp. 38R]